MRITLISCGVVLTGGVLAGSDVRAEDVPIVNPGFETVSRVLVGGEQTNGIGGTGTLVGTRSPIPFGSGVVDWSDPVTVPGWRTYTVPFGSASIVHAGVLRPTAIGNTPFITGIEGSNSLAIQAALVGQATATTLKPNTLYTLSFLGGISQFDSDYFMAVSLTAIDDSAALPIEGQVGVTRLALGTFFPPSNEPDGVMRRYQLTYTTPEVLPGSLVGARVGIHIFGSDGLPRVIYDDFSLTAMSLAPESCDGDVNDDSVVDVDDLNAILSAWLTAVDTCSPLDLANDDGLVDVDDLNVVLSNWQSGCD